MGDLLLPVNGPDLVQSLDTGTQTSVDTEYLAVNDGGQGQVVKYLRAVSPDRDTAVFAETFVVETVDLGDLSGLVVASNQVDSIRISNLQSEE